MYTLLISRQEEIIGLVKSSLPMQSMKPRVEHIWTNFIQAWLLKCTTDNSPRKRVMMDKIKRENLQCLMVLLSNTTQDQGNHNTDLDNFQSASEDGNPSESTETNRILAISKLCRLTHCRQPPNWFKPRCKLGGRSVVTYFTRLT